MCLNPHCRTPFCRGCHTSAEDNRSRLYIQPLRRDGKHRCTFVFPISGRSIVEILTPDTLAARIAGGDYMVIRRAS